MCLQNEVYRCKLVKYLELSRGKATGSGVCYTQWFRRVQKTISSVLFQEL